MAQVQLGEFVVGEVEAGEPRPAHVVDQVLFIGRAAGLHPNKNMGHPGIGQAVAEFGEVALAQHATEAPQAAGLLGNFHRQHRLTVFADLRAFGHEAQAIKVHVCAAGHRHQGLAMQSLLRHVALHPRHRQGPGRLQDRAGVFKHVLDGGADGVGIHRHHPIHRLLGQGKGVLPHPAHGHSVGK